MSRAKRLRQAAILRRRITLIEKIFTPRFKAEMVRMSEQAGQDFQDGGLGRAEVGLDQHRKNIEGLLVDLYEMCGEISWRYLNNLYGKEKASMLQALAALASDWFMTAFTDAQGISGTTKQFLKDVTAKLVSEGVGEVVMGKKIRETMTGMAPWRSRLIARTESHASVMASQQSIIEGMDLPEYYKEWMSGSDGRVRKSHKKADGQLVKPKDSFTVGGDQLRYPGDRQGKAKEVINCLLPDMKVSLCHPEKLFRRRYVGEVINIEVDSLNKLTVTPNHPILTNVGWKPARLVNESDYLIINDRANLLDLVDSDVKGVNANVGELFDSLVNSGNIPSTSTGIVDFHGDVVDSDVEIIDVGGALVNSVETTSAATLQDVLLKLSETTGRILVSDRAIDKFLFRSLDPSDSIVSSFSDFLEFVWTCILETDQVCLTSRSILETQLLKAKGYDISINLKDLAHFEDGQLLIVEGFNFINNFLPTLQELDTISLSKPLNSALATLQDNCYFAGAFPLVEELLPLYPSYENELQT